MPRPVLFLIAVPLTCTLGLVAACSGAETQEVLLAAESSSSSGDSGSSNATSSGSSGTSGTTTSSSGNPSTECEPEEEPNDGKQDANVLAPARCGTLSKDDQKDFLQFQLKSNTRTLSITFTGRIRLRVDVHGKETVELTPDSAGIVPFVPNEDYSIEVSALTATSGNVPWRVAIIEKP